MNERQQTVLFQVNEKGKISVNTLAKLTGVSGVTIRQDLNFLEKHGYLRRVHGSAVALESDDLDTRMMVNFNLKQKLAEYAAALVDDGDSIFIEGGSSNALLAQHLAQTKKVTIITVSYYIAHLLKESNLQVILLGGEYQKRSESVVGELTCLGVKHVNFSKAFIGIDGFDLEVGFSGRNDMRTKVINAIIAKGAENIIITDSSKFGLTQPYLINPTGAINRVITDYRIPEHYCQVLEAQQIKVNRVRE